MSSGLPITPASELLPSAACAAGNSRWKQGVAIPRLAASAVRNRPRPEAHAPGWGPWLQNGKPSACPGRLQGELLPWGPLTSAVPVIPGQGKAQRTGAGEATRCIVAGVRTGGGALRTFVPVWGAGWGDRALVVRTHRTQRPSQAERPPSSTPGEGEGTHPHKTLPGHPAQSPPGSRLHSHLQGKGTGPKDAGALWPRCPRTDSSPGRSSLLPAWPG